MCKYVMSMKPFYGLIRLETKFEKKEAIARMINML